MHGRVSAGILARVQALFLAKDQKDACIAEQEPFMAAITFKNETDSCVDATPHITPATPPGSSSLALFLGCYNLLPSMHSAGLSFIANWFIHKPCSCSHPYAPNLVQTVLNDS